MIAAKTPATRFDPMPVKLSDLVDVFQSSPDDGSDTGAYICRATGTIYWKFDPLVTGIVDEELPDDLDDEEKYLPVPDKRELGHGSRLAISFVQEHLPRDYDEVRDIFRRRHAFRNFKNLLGRRNVIGDWHRYAEAAAKRDLRDWCEVNGIAVEAEPSNPSEGDDFNEGELLRIEARCSAATEGPWVSHVEGRDTRNSSSFIATSGEDIYLIGATPEDQDFIANARHDIPRLIAEIRRLWNNRKDAKD